MNGRRKPRGVRLSDLDKGRLYVIGYRKPRWETLGALDELAPVVALPMRPDAGADAGGASTAPDAAAPWSPARDDDAPPEPGTVPPPEDD